MKEKLEKSNVEQIIELSMVQKGMLYHYLKDANQNIYNVQLSFAIEGDLKLDILKQAFSAVQVQNDALRSVFRWEGISKPVQIILKDCPFEFYYHDLCDYTHDKLTAAIQELCETDHNSRLDLTKLPVKIRVIRRGEEAYLLNITNHHILQDGWSTGILLKEFFACYNSLNKGEQLNFAPKASYSEVQKSTARNLNSSEKQNFWKEYLKDFEASPHFPGLQFDAEVSHQQVKKYSVQRALPQFSHFTRKHRITQAALIYTAYGLLIQRYNAEQDVVIGSTVSNRPALMKGSDQVIGNFINTIPLRVKSDEQTSFLSLLKRVSRSLIDRNTYHDSSLHEINQAIELKASKRLFDSVVGIENYPLDEQLINSVDGLKISLEKVYENTNVSLVFLAFFKEELEIVINYKEGLFTGDYIRSFADDFFMIMEKILADPEQLVSTVHALSAEERKLVIDDFNATEYDYEEQLTIAALFEKQSAATPENTAVVSNGQSLNYDQLNQKANQLAHTLIEKGLGKGDVVSILAEPSSEMVVGILAILKSGAAFLPVSHEFPAARIADMYMNARCKLLLSQKHLTGKLDGKVNVLHLDSKGAYHKDVRNPVVPISADDLAYVIYTSGTTGKPKGVMVRHRNLHNYVAWFRDFINLDDQDKTALITSFAFDLGYSALFPAILSGAALHLLSKEVYATTGKLLDYIEQQGLSYLKMTPSLYATISAHPDFEKIKALRRIVLGGERIRVEDIEKTYALEAAPLIINHYGPTETTIGAIARPIHREDLSQFKSFPAIGKPVNNTRCYVLDKAMNPVSVLSKGELYIGGAGVGAGYLNAPELTAERFLPDPFKKGAFIYRTGDMARWLPEGELEFLGRADEQIKIRGYRVEPAEVEHQLLTMEGIVEAAVLVHSMENDHSLAAYYVSDRSLNEQTIRTYLGSLLPAYMIPEHLILMESMPVNENGKLDRKALPVPGTATEELLETASTEEEKRMVAIWAGVLKLDSDEISVTKSFMEMGGHSLRIILMLNKVYKEFNVLVPINDVFQHPTVRELIAHIHELENASYSAIKKAAKKKYYSLSAAQKRTYFLYEFDKQSVAYNGGMATWLEGELDTEHLEEVFQKLIQRHEILRTSFHLVDEKPVQQVASSVDFKLEYAEAGESEVYRNLARFTRPFNLSEAPLFRVGLVKVRPKKHLLIVDLHHIISDGVSGEILMKEFMSLYKGESVAPLKLHYKDFAEWQQSDARQKEINKQEEFWKREFQGDIPVLDLPTDFSRPQIKRYEGETISLELDQSLTRKLHQMAAENKTTMFTLLFSAYSMLLSRLTNQEDIVIGSPVAGRNHPDLEHMLGMFVNTLPLRSQPDPTLSFEEFLARTKSRTLKAFDHQDYPYEGLLDILQLERDTSRNPLFDTFFAYQNFQDTTLEIPGLTLKPLEASSTISKFDLSLYVYEQGDKLSLSFEYDTHLFREKTITDFIAWFRQLLQSLTENPQVKIGQLEILTDAVREELLQGFNDTAFEYDDSQSIVSAFEQRVEQRGDALAVVAGANSLSYDQLNAKANQLAATILSADVTNEAPVGILLNRTEGLLISMLAVLKTGCAYVPIDPDYPAERIRYIVEHSGLKLVLTESGLTTKLNLPDAIRQLDIRDEEIGRASAANQSVVIPPHSLAYMIYTSGSTGKPKGVMVEHANVINFIEGICNRVSLSAETKMLGLTTVSFDIFVLESLLPLLKGYQIVLAGSADQKDAYALRKLIKDQGVNALQITPSHLKLLLSDGEQQDFLSAVQTLMIGGEAMPDELLAQAKAACAGDIWNMYGPTETTVWSTIRNLNNCDTVDIGKPIANTTVRVVNQSGQLQPPGVPGELLIGGKGVTRGYVNNPEQTAERFIADPVTGKGIVYRTGDLVRWLPDGNLAYLGRMDNQVKIHGFRIELGEVESLLVSHPDITAAAVAAKNANGDRFLVAYYISEKQLERADIRSYLTRSLPAYMIPAHFMPLAAMPLTPNGKLDRKAMPDPEIKAVGEYVAPASEEEKLLAQIWSDVLDMNKVGVTDNFFSVGGDSIKSIRIGARLRKHGYAVTVQDIFVHQTIGSLAGALKPLETNEESDGGLQELSLTQPEPQIPTQLTDLTYQGLTPDQWATLQAEYEIEDIYPLSPMQEGMLYHAIADGESGSYLGQVTCTIRGDLDLKLLKKSMDLLMVRHEVLRTVFLHEGLDQPLQVVLKSREITFSSEDHSETFQAGHRNAILKSKQLSERSEGFDLAKDVLMKLAVIRVSEEEHLLIWTHHHVLMDGWCMGQILNEFQAVYQQLLDDQQVTLPAVRPYAGYIQWLDQRDPTPSKTYWKEYLKHFDAPVSLPAKPAKERKSTYLLRTEKVKLGEKGAAALKLAASKSTVTPNILFQAAWAVLLSKYNHSKQVTFGTVVSGRPPEVAGVESMIGLFINTIPVMLEIDADMTVDQLLRNLQRESAKGVSHHYHPLSEIIALRETESDLFDHILTYQNTPLSLPGKQTAGLDITVEDNFIQTNYNLSVTAFPEDQFEIRFDYNAHQFARSTIQSLALQLKNLLLNMAAQPEATVNEISLYSADEMKHLTDQFTADLESEYDGLTMQQRLAESFVRHEHETAIEYGGKSYSYTALRENVAAISHLLATRKLPAESFVGIYCKDRYKLISSLLAVLNARLAFVPLEVGLPKHRLQSMIEQTGLTCIISDLTTEEAGELEFVQSVDLLSLDDLQTMPDCGWSPADAHGLDDTIYAYFTSGSTGKPKGVLGRNKSLSHFIQWEAEAFGLDKTFRFSQLTNPGFDAFLRDTLLPLSIGATLCIPSDEVFTSGDALSAWIAQEQIALVHAVPSIFRLFSKPGAAKRDFSKLRYVMLAGEKIIPSELENWYTQYGETTRLVNLYGATETTLIKAARPIKPTDTTRSFMPVQQASGSQLILLDHNLMPCPEGAIGEIYIRTPFMTKGYLGQPELTREVFISNPFGESADDLLYKTGDLGRLHPDNEVEILGRKDHQVKIRGVRVELDEIKSSLLSYSGISDAVVTVNQNDQGEQFICAYLISTEQPDQDDLRSYLEERLSKAMLPAHLVSIGEIPLSPNGKVDLKALPDPEGAAEGEILAPANEIEIQLAEIWAAVVGMEVGEVSTNKTFFEMGGHSLKLLLFVNRINKHFEVKIPIQEIFTRRTILDLSDYLITIKQIQTAPAGDNEMIEISL
jgi:amino acid adenylation domain-containing protein